MARFCWVCLGNGCYELYLAKTGCKQFVFWKKKSKIYLGIVEYIWVHFVLEDDAEYRNACKYAVPTLWHRREFGICVVTLILV